MPDELNLSATNQSWMTVAEVAGMWQVSKMTVYRMVHTGALGAIRVRRSFRIPRAAFEAFDISGINRSDPILNHVS